MAIRKGEIDAESLKDTEKYFKQVTSPFKHNFIDDFIKTRKRILRNENETCKSATEFV